LLKTHKKHTVIQKIFFQGRHTCITAIIACHTDMAISPDLKKNAFINVFTEDTAARAYFDRASGNLDKEGKQRAHAAVKTAFAVKHQKLVWVRDQKTFYKFTATKHDDFQFGSPHIREYSSQIEATNKVNTSNRFLGLFT
jgi:hypothetical protein